MKRLLLVALVGLTARLALSVASPPAGRLARFEPSVVAANLNHGRGFVFRQYGASYRAWKEPLYILLLAGVTRATGDRDAPILALQWLTGIGCGIAVALIAHRLLRDSRAATVAGLLASVNPFLVYYDTHFVHPLSLDVLLFLALVSSLLRALESEPRAGSRRSLGAGLVAGIALLERGTLLAAGVGAWVASLAASQRADWGRRARLAAVWLATALAVVSPWIVRNWWVVGRPVLTTDFAHILWLGNNPASNGTYSDAAGRRVIDAADPAFRQRIRGSSELEQYDLFLGEVRRFVADDPRCFASLVWARLSAFFWLTPNAGILYAPSHGVLYGLFFSALLGAGLLGSAVFWRAAAAAQRAAAVVLVGAVLGLAGVHSLTALNLKHRVPFEMALCVFAAALASRRRTQVS